MHANARLTERVRQELVLVVASGVGVSVAAARFGVSRTTVYRWVRRAAAGGDRWWQDRSSAPLRSPNRVDGEVVAEIVRLRATFGLGPVRIGGCVGVAPSTVWRVLKAAGMNRVRTRGEQLVARYERACCGDLVHVDTKRAGYIPDGGGRFVRGIVGYRTEARRRVHTGHVWFHAAVDDHTRLAYVEVLDGHTGADAAGFVTRAASWFASMGITIRQVMTDNALEYTQSRQFQAALGDIDHITTRPYRPQTNGKVERFFRTLKDEWLYATTYRSETERRQALTRYLHYYNNHRPHTAIGNKPPITRVTNLPEQHR